MDAILREKEREDKLQSAKRKLKSYRARQQSKTNNRASVVSASPNSKRVSAVSSSGSGSGSAPVSPVKSSTVVVKGHAHRRSSSRAGSISVVMPHAKAEHNRRASVARRHSRNVSISFANSLLDLSPSSANSAAQASAPSSSSSSSSSSSASRPSPGFPTSTSSPSLSSAIANFAAQQQHQQQQQSQQGPVSPYSPLKSTNSKRQSVPHSFSAAPNGRILSPQTSPVLQQNSSSSGAFTGGPQKRASLQMPKSPSALFAESFNSSNPVNSISAPSTSTAVAAPQHARRPSKHARRTSVATRRESMEIMSGISMSTFNFPDESTSPNPNHSATGAFLSSENMSRSNTSQSQTDGPTTAQEAIASWPMEERQLSEEDERKMALHALEGRLTAPSDAIELPASALSYETEQGPSSSTASSRESKRSSWNGGSAPLANFGGKGATHLGMLVEEEEEEEDEEEANESISALHANNSFTSSTASPSNSSATSSSSLIGGKRQRPSSLIFPPSRALPFNNANSATGPLSPRDQAAVPTPRSAPRPLSLSASVSSPCLTASPADANTALKTGRRLSGLRSLTLTSPEHALNPASAATSPASASPAPLSSSSSNKRQSLLFNNYSFAQASSSSVASPSGPLSASKRPYSISSTGSFGSSMISPDASRSSINFGQRANAGSAFSTKRNSIGGARADRSSFSSSNLSNSQGPSFSSPSTSCNPVTTPAKRTSLSFPSAANRKQSDNGSHASGFGGFGDLVMEESVLEEEEEQNEESFNEGDSVLDQKSSLLDVEPPALSRSNTSSSTSEDPVILSMQVQALRSQVEHLRNEATSLQSQLGQAEASRKVEVDALREEMSEMREESLALEEEREMLREDIDGWRTRCSGLEKTLREERVRFEDERKEGLLLREKVRKLSDRLANSAPASASTNVVRESEDQALATAQAKLIGEMRDQIFTLAAALERERLKVDTKNLSGDFRNNNSRSTSPLLQALASQDENIAAMEEERCKPSSSSATSSPACSTTVAKFGRHHNESATSSNASSYNFSSISSNSVHSGLGNVTEDTSIADDDSVFGGNGSWKSPSSPAFSNYYSNAAAATSSSSLTSLPISAAASSNSLPLRREDSNANVGGLDTLAEEDEEATEEEMDDEEEEEELMETQQEREDRYNSIDDRVPELVPDEFRGRTQSCSTGSTDTNDHMPLTPIKEHSPASSSSSTSSSPAKQQQSKPLHMRSDSFIRQWAFPKGAVESLSSPEDEEHQQDNFWNIYSDPLPALPVAPAVLDLPPFSAEITLDDDYFSAAFGQHTAKNGNKNRPASLLLSNAAGGPPPSRSSYQASRLSGTADQVDAQMPNSAFSFTSTGSSSAATPSTAGSRLSQGFSNLWGWKTSSTPVTHQAAEAPYSPFSATTTASPTTMQQQPPAVPPKSVKIGGAGKRLLRLEASPLSRLDFSRSCDCEHAGGRVIRL